MSLQVILPNTVEPVSTAEAERQARIDVTDTDTPRRIASARRQVETQTWRSLLLQTFEERCDGFPARIRPQRSPLRSVVSIQYLDTAGTLQTLSSSLYDVFAQDEPGCIEPAYGQVWPSTYAVRNAVRVQYRAGHALPFTADAATDVLSAAGHWFADGDAVHVWTSGGTIPTGLSQGWYYARDVTAAVSLKLAATSGGAAVDITAAGTTPNFLGEIPPDLRDAMLLIFSELSLQRENSITGTIQSRTLLAADDLCRPWKVHY